MSKEIQLQMKDKSNQIPIKQFELKDMCDHSACLMIAKRASGKSWVVRAILHHYADKIPVGSIICPTDRMNKFYSSFLPDSYVHFEFSSDLVKRILMRQRIMKDKAIDRAKHGKKTNTHAFLIMDDCLADKNSWANDQMTKELLLNGRHYDIMYILTMQYPLGIAPILRENFDYVFLLADDTISNQKRIFDHYAGMFPNFEAFRQVFGELTKDYGCMVINKRGIRNNFLDKIFYYKAPDLSGCKIQIGGGQFNKYHNDNYNEKWQLKDDLFAGAIEDKFERNQIKKNRLVVHKLGMEEQGKGKQRQKKREY